MRKGLHADIYSAAYFRRDGLSVLKQGIETVTVIDDVVAQQGGAISTPDEKHPPVVLVRRNLSDGLYIHAEPLRFDDELKEWVRYTHLMFGGRYIMGDSRLRYVNKYPIPLHDRDENNEH